MSAPVCDVVLMVAQWFLLLATISVASSQLPLAMMKFYCSEDNHFN
jgi:hypothetical protein